MKVLSCSIKICLLQIIQEIILMLSYLQTFSFVSCARWPVNLFTLWSGSQESGSKTIYKKRNAWNKTTWRQTKDMPPPDLPFTQFHLCRSNPLPSNSFEKLTEFLIRFQFAFILSIFFLLCVCMWWWSWSWSLPRTIQFDFTSDCLSQKQRDLYKSGMRQEATNLIFWRTSVKK